MRLKPIVFGISLMALAGAGAHAQDRSQTDAQSLSQSSRQSAPQQSTQQDQRWTQQDQGSMQRDQRSMQQDQRWTRDQPRSAQQQELPGTMAASDLIGKQVVDRQGEDLGKIDEIVVDLQSGEIRAAVLSVGGVLGMGGKEVALPMDELTRGEGGRFTADIDKRKLDDAEGFAKGQMPGLSDEYWSRTASASRDGSNGGNGGNGGDSSARAQDTQGMNLVRASEVKGREVQDANGKAVGEVRDLFVNVDEGKVEHVIVDVKDAGRAQVEADAFSSGTGDRLVVDKSRDQLASMATSDSDQRRFSQARVDQPAAQPQGQQSRSIQGEPTTSNQRSEGRS